ncbi:MAG: hypothetical protein HYY15_00565 [Candidatus Omnitrophica bacterium]|nr:hypothetical protein [Candidatus Omnitrophota bacterium]
MAVCCAFPGCAVIATRYVEARDPAGVLILAHGGSPRWNHTVRAAVAQARLAGPVETAFGMGMHGHEVHDFQAAVDRLQADGVTRIIVLPLLLSSSSDVFRQFEYLFGMRPDAPWPDAGGPVALSVPVTMLQPLDGDPVVGDIVFDRVRRLSRDPARETVVLVAHGPVDEADNQRWLDAMAGASAVLERDGGFAKIERLTLRDDAPDAVREEATRQLRQAVEQAGQATRVLVVPVLLAPGGIEQKIPKRLAGLSYAFTGETLLPHPALSRWIAARVQAARRPLSGALPVRSGAGTSVIQ